MVLHAANFEQPRRLITWRYAAAISTDSLGVVYGPSPPTTPRIPCMPGAQAIVRLLAVWSTAARAAPGFKKLVLNPEYDNPFGTGAADPVPTGPADQATNFVVMTADGSDRVAAGGLVLPQTSGTTVPGGQLKYRPRTIDPGTTGPATRIVATELVSDRIEWFRATAPVGPATYGQDESLPYLLLGTEPFRSSGGLLTGPNVFGFSFGWIGDNDVEDTDPAPFVTGDALSIVVRIGRP